MLNRWAVPKELMLSWPYGQLFIISAPAGAGKTTLVKYLVAAFPNVVQAPSLTTRPRRDDEIDGKDYHFVSKEEFLKESLKESFSNMLNCMAIYTGHRGKKLNVFGYRDITLSLFLIPGELLL